MKVGDLVKLKSTEVNPDSDRPGFIMKIDEQFYGARTAYKIVGSKRQDAIIPSMVNCIGPTQTGIQDRVLVLWTMDGEYEYFMSSQLEVISENKK